jgi:hypothetical protein
MLEKNPPAICAMIIVTREGPTASVKQQNPLFGDRRSQRILPE